MDNAGTLRDWIDVIRADGLSQYMDPNVPVDIVAHSMGGLVARAYLHHHAGAGEVDRVFMFGTPNAGTTLMLFEGSGFCRCHLTDLTGGLCPMPQEFRAFWEMSPLFLAAGGEFERQVTSTAGAKFLLVGSDRDRDCKEPEECRPLWGVEDDTVVSQYSAQYLPASVPLTDILGTPTANSPHWTLHSGPILRELLLPYLENRFRRP